MVNPIGRTVAGSYVTHEYTSSMDDIVIHPWVVMAYAMGYPMEYGEADSTYHGMSRGLSHGVPYSMHYPITCPMVYHSSWCIPWHVTRDDSTHGLFLRGCWPHGLPMRRPIA